MSARIVVVVALVAWSCAACVGGKREGSACKHSSDCNDSIVAAPPADECVFVDKGGTKGGVCLPIIRIRTMS